MPYDLRNSWGKPDNRNKSGHRDSQKRSNYSNTVATLVGKQVVVITRTGYWHYGTLRDVDNRGILLTNTMRIEPVRDEQGNEVQDSEHAVTLRRVLPFELPVDGLGTVVVRKMFVPWSNVGQILRAKTKEEIEKEGGEN